MVTREFIGCNGSLTVHHSFLHLFVNSKAAFSKLTDQNGRVCYDGPYALVILELAYILDNFSTLHHGQPFIYKEKVLF